MVSSKSSTSNGEALSICERTKNKSNNGNRGKSSNGYKGQSKLEAREINSASIARSITTL